MDNNSKCYATFTNKPQHDFAFAMWDLYSKIKCLPVLAISFNYWLLTCTEWQRNALTICITSDKLTFLGIWSVDFHSRYCVILFFTAILQVFHLFSPHALLQRYCDIKHYTEIGLSNRKLPLRVQITHRIITHCLHINDWTDRYLPPIIEPNIEFFYTITSLL